MESSGSHREFVKLVRVCLDSIPRPEEKSSLVAEGIPLQIKDVLPHCFQGGPRKEVYMIHNLKEGRVLLN